MSMRTELDALRSHAATLGVFEDVVGHAMTNPPATGIAVAFEFLRQRRSRSSGLATTSVVRTWTASIYQPLASPNAEDVELAVTNAADLLIAAYHGDFELGGNVRCVDLLGQDSEGLAADGGYAKAADVPLRAIVVTIPLIVNDAYMQAG